MIVRYMRLAACVGIVTASGCGTTLACVDDAVCEAIEARYGLEVPGVHSRWSDVFEYEGVEYHVVGFEFGHGYDCASGCAYGLLCTITVDGGISDRPILIDNDFESGYTIDTVPYCGDQVLDASFAQCNMPGYHLQLMESSEFQDWSSHRQSKDYCRNEFVAARAFGVIP